MVFVIWKHYSEHPIDVFCDRCSKKTLLSIGLADKYDLCLDCVEELNSNIKYIDIFTCGMFSCNMISSVSNVTCDKCKKSNIKIFVSHADTALCLSCVEKIMHKSSTELSVAKIAGTEILPTTNQFSNFMQKIPTQPISLTNQSNLTNPTNPMFPTLPTFPAPTTFPRFFPAPKHPIQPTPTPTPTPAPVPAPLFPGFQESFKWPVQSTQPTPSTQSAQSAQSAQLTQLTQLTQPTLFTFPSAPHQPEKIPSILPTFSFKEAI